MEQALLEYGLLGIVVAALAWAWRHERTRNDSMTDRFIGISVDAAAQAERQNATNEQLVKAVAALTDEVRRNAGGG